MSPKLPFALTDAERAACTRLFEHIEGSRIPALHRDNENQEKSETQTALIRGQIKALREILRLREPPKFQELPPGH